MPIKDNKYNEEAINELRTKLLVAGLYVLYDYNIVHDIVYDIIEYLLRNKNKLNHIQNAENYAFKMLFNAINKEKKRKTRPMSRIRDIDISVRCLESCRIGDIVCVIQKQASLPCLSFVIGDERREICPGLGTFIKISMTHHKKIAACKTGNEMSR